MEATLYPLSSRVVDGPQSACGPPKEMKTPSVQQPLSMEASPSPLSSRAQPRDLQFRGPFLGMFFDGAKPRDLQSSHPQAQLQPEAIMEQ